MPAGDRTGPMGRGPMSGRGLGYCAGYGVPGSMNTVPGWGWGFGRGWRHCYYATGLPGWSRNIPGPYADLPPYYASLSPEQEAQALKAQAEHFEQGLAEVRRRIAELEAARARES